MAEDEESLLPLYAGAPSAAAEHGRLAEIPLPTSQSNPGKLRVCFLILFGSQSANLSASPI